MVKERCNKKLKYGLFFPIYDPIELPLRPRVSHGYNLEVSDQVSWVAPAWSLLDRPRLSQRSGISLTLFGFSFNPFLNPGLFHLSLSLSLTVFWTFVNRENSLSKPFLIRELGVFASNISIMPNMNFIFKIFITLLLGVILENHVLLYDWYITLCCIIKEKTL